jgi:hypothetical protein
LIAVDTVEKTTFVVMGILCKQFIKKKRNDKYAFHVRIYSVNYKYTKKRGEYGSNELTKVKVIKQVSSRILMRRLLCCESYESFYK